MRTKNWPVTEYQEVHAVPDGARGPLSCTNAAAEDTILGVVIVNDKFPEFPE